MTNPQTWTLLGALIALIGGMMVMMFQMSFHYIRSQFESMEARMSARFDQLDRDVQGIAEKVFRDDRG